MILLVTETNFLFSFDYYYFVCILFYVWQRVMNKILPLEAMVMKKCGDSGGDGGGVNHHL